MTGVMTLYRSSIGKKTVMAVTGLLLLGYVVIHMWGNLKVYQGAAELNQYAHDLRLLGAPVLGYYQAIWIARIVLLGAVLLHIWSAVSLWQQSNAGRAQGYNEVKRTQPAYTYAAYTMRWGGVLIALFIIFHILHLTVGLAGTAVYSQAFMHPEGSQYFAYENVVAGFQVWYVSLFYIITMFFLGAHLFHGTWSMFQTVGLNNERYTSFFRGLALLVAGAVVIGNISIPLAVMAGIVTL